MKKGLIGILTALAFIASFLLANYVNDHGVSLHSGLNKTIYWIESLFNDTAPELNKIPVIAEQTAFKPRQQYQDVEVGGVRACKDTSLGEVKYKRVGDIYTWTDEDDVYHVSDKPPKEGEFKLLNYAGEQVFDYFSLDLNTENLPYDFNQKLTQKLNKLFEIYGQLLDRSSLKKVDINLRIYLSKTAFKQIKTKHNMPISDNTLGFYSHATNQAYLLLTHHEATMRTAIHEATHAINRGIIGYSPKWLNEGLAEYSEYIDVVGHNGRVYPNKNWTDNNRMAETLLPLTVLMTASKKDWNSALRARLYATSWAFIYFMMDNQQKKEMLAKVIRNEQKNLCDVTSQQQVEKLIGMPVKRLQKQFGHWARLTLRAQSI